LQRPLQIEGKRGIVGSQACGGQEEGDRLVHSPGFAVDQANLVVGLCVGRVYLQGQEELLQRLFLLSHGIERNSEVDMRIGESRVETYRLAEFGDGLVVPPPLVVMQAENIAGFGRSGIEAAGDRGLGERLAEMTRALQGQGEVVVPPGLLG